ncbi:MULTISPECIES: DUF3352 domain-containing protein [Pseudanabaena]|uniref:DUF3352 domain-containing protein n=2 Tax=Pseudanabaena TaxID=1152 RepID=L8N0K4_9CYAN|nr:MULTISPECIES: DUF3352 domain-containing protein [Pseudanabaena]ELS31768.1 hypothetical protein Pse7429DRAFT_3176 [Pseudanabaena biceps PCC 7429]MDG3495964.1 DUF3352 domain-containing protein [Pseudanabaena catenata USMAC16]
MTETKPNLLPLIGGAAVVVAGGVGAYFFFNKPTITPTASGSGALTVVPKQSLMAMSLSTDGESLSKIEQFLSPETKKLYDDAIAKVKTNLSTGDFDYEKDVKPWIGKNVTIAILPSTKTASLLPRTQAVAPVRYVPMSDTGSVQFVQDKVTADTKAVPNILVVVEVKDKVGAEKFLTDKVKTKAGGKEKQSDYKGVKVTQYGEGTNASVTAMVGDYLIVTPQEQTTQKAIDTFKGEASLAGSVGADDLKIQNPVFQVFVPNFGESIVQLSALSPEPQTIPPESLEQLKKVKSLNMGFGIDDAGIRFKALGKFDPDAIAALKNSPNKVIAQIPSQAFMVINGFNINSSWEQFVKSAEKAPELKKSIDDARTQLKSSPLALDLDKDIFGWMDGEYAIAPIEGKPEGILAQTQGLAPLLLIQTTKRAAGESLLTKLDDFVAKNGGKVSKKDVGGVEVTEWSAPGAPGAIVSHGWSQQDVVFLTASPIVSLFVPKPTAAIDGDATFKSVISTLPTSNVGYFYIDADKTWNIVQAFMPAAEKAKTPPEAKALIESIRGLAITATYPNQDTASVEAILALKKGGK